MSSPIPTPIPTPTPYNPTDDINSVISIVSDGQQIENDVISLQQGGSLVDKEAILMQLIGQLTDISSRLQTLETKIAPLIAKDIKAVEDTVSSWFSCSHK